jgi:uncharacterized protein
MNVGGSFPTHERNRDLTDPRRMPAHSSVDAYIADAPSEARPILEALRRIITSSVPRAEEGISYGVPFYKHHGALAGYAAYKEHVSFGLGGDALDSKDAKTLEDEGYTVLKKTIHIKFDQKVPTATLEKMLRDQAAVNEARGMRSS